MSTTYPASNTLPARSASIVPLRNHVYLAYLDDSGSTGRNLADKDCPFQIIGALLINADEFDVTEILLSGIIDEHVPEDMRSKFEFHASKLWAGESPFDALDPVAAHNAVEECARLIHDMEFTYVYGAVDKKILSEQVYASASPIDIAFRLCMECVEKWFCERAKDEVGLLIADDPGEKNQTTKNEIRNAFRVHRRKVRSSGHNRGKFAHMMDDMFFGNSADSLGIQLVDVCNFLVNRHLMQRRDTEGLYEMIEPRIYVGRMYPE